MEGFYYLHQNGELVYKHPNYPIEDARESDLVKAIWPFYNDRATAWNILIESLSIGAKRERVFDLAKKWGCNDFDAQNYAEMFNLELDYDGGAKTVRVRGDLETYPESNCGFGDTYLEAFADLCSQFGYTGGKMWNATFSDILKEYQNK